MRRSSLYPWTYLAAWRGGRRSQSLFRDVQTYAMFIGQPRSGTSLLGSILNAHPDMTVAQELNALRYVSRGYSREQLFWLLLERDADFAKSGRTWTGYNYAVESQWQGRVRSLRVIGDKKAGLSTDQLGRRPEVLEKLMATVQVPVKIIHVTRDPYNVITTVHRRRSISLEKSADIFFRRCETNHQLLQAHGNIIRTIPLEDLIAQPYDHLERLCDFLNVEAPPSYLDACAGLLFDKPRQTMRPEDWPPTLIAEVAKRAEAFPFLDGYRRLKGDAVRLAKAA